jgi:hypothetical protein
MVNQGLVGRNDACIAQKLAHIIVSHASNLVKQKLDRQQYFSTDLGECHMFSNISHSLKNTHAPTDTDNGRARSARY